MYKSAQFGNDSKNEKKKKRSVVWNHFNVVTAEDGGTEFGVCKHCQAKYKCSKNGKSFGTSNLLEHLKEKHRELQLNLGDESTEDFVFSQDNYRAALLKWIVECDQAFTAPQQTAFLDLVKSLNPNAKTVSSTTLKRDLIKKYSEKFEQVKSTVLDIPGKVSFTMDGWTSKNIFPFVNIRAHWIDAQWEQQSVLLDFSEIHGDHSGENLSKIFLKCLHRYEIPTLKILAITLDNASNNGTFVTSFRNELIKQGYNISFDDIHVRCLAHVMNLSVQDILASLKCMDDVGGNNPNEESDSENEKENDEQDSDQEKEEKKHSKTILEKLRKPIKKIRKSPKMRQLFRETCTAFGIKYKVPIIDMRVRWNSSYLMIERAIEQKEPLDDFCTKTMSLRITPNDWNDLEIVKNLLKKFERATQLISMERHPTISAYLPTLYWLIDSLQAFIDRNSGIVKIAAEKGLAKLRKYEDKMNSSKVVLIALFLNPALKLTYFKEHNFTKGSIKEVEKMIESVYESNYGCKDLVQNHAEDDDFFAHMFKRRRVENKQTEFQTYLRCPLVSPKVDLLKHWKAQEHEFPSLANMARDYLGAQSSSVPVERDFSGGVDLVTSTRCSLKPETIQACMCLKSWFKNKI